jgi:hypothetical protein
MSTNRIAWIAVLALLLTACRATEHAAVEDSADARPEEKTMRTDASAVPRELMDRLIADVVAKSGAPESDVELVRAEHVTWRDASLGCPQPNMGYAQVLSPGWWVILRVGREDFDYRASESGHFTRCTGSTKQPPIRYPEDT